MDVLTAEQRQLCMSRNRGQNTGPELRLRRALWRDGLRYRVRLALAGRPDIVFPGARVVIFVDGCFWHCCPQHGARPKTNGAFWRNKLRRNQERDREVTESLQTDGWTVIRVWEHQTREELPSVVAHISRVLSGRVARK